MGLPLSNTDPKQRLDEAIRKRDTLKDNVQRIQGRLDSARAELKGVEEECRAKGVDPTQLNAAIQALEARFDVALTEIETRIAGAEAQVAPFLTEA